MLLRIANSRTIGSSLLAHHLPSPIVSPAQHSAVARRRWRGLEPGGCFQRRLVPSLVSLHTLPAARLSAGVGPQLVSPAILSFMSTLLGNSVDSPLQLRTKLAPLPKLSYLLPPCKGTDNNSTTY